jgi:hypothetical protein
MQEQPAAEHACIQPSRPPPPAGSEVELTDLLQLWAHVDGKKKKCGRMPHDTAPGIGHRPASSPPSSLAVHVSARTRRDHYIFPQVTHEIVMEKSRKKKRKATRLFPDQPKFIEFFLLLDS